MSVIELSDAYTLLVYKQRLKMLLIYRATRALTLVYGLLAQNSPYRPQAYPQERWMKF